MQTTCLSVFIRLRVLAGVADREQCNLVEPGDGKGAQSVVLDVARGMGAPARMSKLSDLTEERGQTPVGTAPGNVWTLHWCQV